MKLRNHARQVACLGILVGALLLLSSPGFAQPFRAIDLGTLDGTPASFGFGLNNNSQAVGASTAADANLRGFMWLWLPFEIAPLPGDLLSQAFGINDVGQVVAMSFDLGETNVHGLLRYSSVVTDLGPLAPRGLNSFGDIAGYWSTSTAAIALVDHAARWQTGTLTDLGTLGGSFSYAAALSNWGQVVGWSYTSGDSVIRATLWQNGVVRDLGTLGGPSSQAYDISRESGHVVGVADTSAGIPHAFLFRVDATGAVLSRTNLGELGGGSSYAYGVNNLSQVVGTSDGRAFRWESGVMTDLNTLLPADSGWRLESARAINDGGQIVGSGVHHGQFRAFLLTQVGDLDADADVDLADYAKFSFCMGGPNTGAPPYCFPWDFVFSDFDGDGDVDEVDFATFQRAYPLP